MKNTSFIRLLMLGVLAVPLFADNTVCGSVIHDQGPDASGNGYKVSYIRVKIGKKEAHAVGVARVELPINVLIQEVHGCAKDWNDSDLENNFTECARGGDCPIGWSHFDNDPEITVDEPRRVRVVSWTFENWSHNWDRNVKIVVRYQVNPAATVSSVPKGRRTKGNTHP